MIIKANLILCYDTAKEQQCSCRRWEERSVNISDEVLQRICQTKLTLKEWFYCGPSREEIERVAREEYEFILSSYMIRYPKHIFLKDYTTGVPIG